MCKTRSTSSLPYFLSVRAHGGPTAHGGRGGGTPPLAHSHVLMWVPTGMHKDTRYPSSEQGNWMVRWLLKSRAKKTIFYRITTVLTTEFVVVDGIAFAVRKKTWCTVDRDGRGNTVVVVQTRSFWVDARVSGLSTLEITPRGAGA